MAESFSSVALRGIMSTRNSKSKFRERKSGILNFFAENSLKLFHLTNSIPVKVLKCDKLTFLHSF